jgi:hypothetical protein
VTVPEVNEALDRRAGLITEHERARALSVEIARMDKIYSYFDKRAEGGDAAAGNICIKASERKSVAVARVEKVQPEPSSFDKIRAAIDRLNAKHGSGLSLDAQRKAVIDFLDGGKWTLLDEFTEIESEAQRPARVSKGACRLQEAQGEIGHCQA